MSLTVQSLNGDTTFLLTFSPPDAPLLSPGLFPSSFTILVDPWLTGPATILSTVFSISEQKTSPCIASLKDLEHDPDIILISQDKPDHCHEETLRQLPKDCQSTILTTPSAARKIKSWNHFHPQLVKTLSKFSEEDPRSIYRQVLPPMSPRGACGELTMTWLPAPHDLTGLHHAIGITYRLSCSVSPANSTHYLDLPLSPPLSPPASPASFRTVASSPRTIVPSPYNDREKTLSVIYSPHGVSYDIIRPYASSHLVHEAALPLTALIHSFDSVDNPWYLGGNVSAGSPGGLHIASSLYARAWISAHDADKDNRGLSVLQTRIGKYDVGDVRKMLHTEYEKKGMKRPVETNIVALAPGEQHKIISN